MRRLGWFALGMLLLQSPASEHAVAQSGQANASRPSLHYEQGLIIEYGRAIAVLQRGIKQNWNRDQYLRAFDAPDQLKIVGENLSMRATIQQTIEWRMHEPGIWDEQPPIGVQAAQLIEEFSQQRYLLIQVRDANAHRSRNPSILAP
jgi:hypothetical protein